MRPWSSEGVDPSLPDLAAAQAFDVIEILHAGSAEIQRGDEALIPLGNAGRVAEYSGRVGRFVNDDVVVPPGGVCIGCRMSCCDSFPCGLPGRQLRPSSRRPGCRLHGNAASPRDQHHACPSGAPTPVGALGSMFRHQVQAEFTGREPHPRDVPGRARRA